MKPEIDTIIFCGRIMHQKEVSAYNLQTKSKWRSESLNKAHIMHSIGFTNTIRSNSLRVPGPKPDTAPATGSYRHPDSCSRKHKVFIGPVKIRPEMELSEIRKRQGRRAPVPMFPVVGGDESVIVGGKSGGGRSHWGLLRPLRCRSHLASVLARAFGCVPTRVIWSWTRSSHVLGFSSRSHGWTGFLFFLFELFKWCWARVQIIFLLFS